MHIGACTLHLRLLESHSLKEKRRVVKSIEDRVRNKFNVSIAEIDGLDKWQWATLGVACVSNDVRFANSILSNVVNFVSGIRLADQPKFEIDDPVDCADAMALLQQHGVRAREFYYDTVGDHWCFEVGVQDYARACAILAKYGWQFG